MSRRPTLRKTTYRESQRIHIFRTLITLGKENQTAEITRRIRLTWAAVGKLGTTLRTSTLPINLKKKVFNTCVLSVFTYGMETMTLTVKSANRLRTTQQAIERTMLGVSLRDHKRQNKRSASHSQKR